MELDPRCVMKIKSVGFAESLWIMKHRDEGCLQGFWLEHLK